MGRENEAVGLRTIRDGEAALFATWEAAERPYPWAAASFPANTLVEEHDGAPAGYAVLQVVGDEAYLSNLMIAPPFRRRGLGARMLQKVIMWAASNGAQRVMLDVDTANLPAITLYRKMGFEFIERRAQSYPRGEDAFIMRRQLK